MYTSGFWNQCDEFLFKRFQPFNCCAPFKPLTHRTLKRFKPPRRLERLELFELLEPVIYIPNPVRLSRGSRMSRRASPSRLMPNTVMKMHKPGNSGSHQAVLM